MRANRRAARFGFGVPGSSVEELTVKESRRMFNRQCQETLGVSGKEYLHRVDTDTIPADWDSWKVCWIRIIEPFGRA